MDIDCKERKQSETTKQMQHSRRVNNVPFSSHFIHLFNDRVAKHLKNLVLNLCKQFSTEMNNYGICSAARNKN